MKFKVNEFEEMSSAVETGIHFGINEYFKNLESKTITQNEMLDFRFISIMEHRIMTEINDTFELEGVDGE